MHARVLYCSYGEMGIRPRSDVVGQLCYRALDCVPRMSTIEVRQLLMGLQVLGIRMQSQLFRCVHHRLDELVRG